MAPGVHSRPFTAYAGKSPYLFVSYAHADAGWVYRELTRLHERGFRIWYDEGIEPGATWTDELASAIDGCTGILFFVSKNSVASRNCTNEVHFAIEAEKPLLAIHYEETPLPSGLKLTIGMRQSVIQGDLSEQRYERKLFDAAAALLGEEIQPAVDVSAPVPGFRGRAAIAVLPFRNLSNDPDQAYFAEGLTEDLIHNLQSWRTFPVIARQSMGAFRDDDIDVRELSRELGVGYVLEGSVRRAAEQLRISARLVDARSGAQIWAERFDGEMADIFALQDEISQRIVGAIEPELTQQETGRARRIGTEDLVAWDHHLRGHAGLDIITYEGLIEARTHWTRALELDPKFAHAHAGLATVDMYLLLHHRGQLSDSEAEACRINGQTMAEKSMQLDPQYFYAHMVVAVFLIHGGEYERAISVSEEAVGLCPGSSQTHRNLAYALFRGGRFEEALGEFVVAKRLSPHDPFMWEIVNQEGACHFFLGNYEEALDLASRAISLNRRVLWPHLFKTLALGATGRIDDARLALTQFLEDVPDFTAEQLQEIDPKLGEPFLQALREVGWKP